MKTTTRFPNGATNVEKPVTLGDYIAQDPSKAHQFFDDFDTYTAAQWTVTETDAAATEALLNADGGVLRLTNTAADNDLIAMQKVGESFLFDVTKSLWFKALFRISDATQSDLVIGLQITDTTPLAVTDGVYFLKVDGSAAISLLIVKNSTVTTVPVGTLTNNTFYSIGYVFDNRNQEFRIFLNDVLVAKTSVLTNLPDDEELTISFAVQNGEAVAKTLDIDYIFASKER